MHIDFSRRFAVRGRSESETYGVVFTSAQPRALNASHSAAVSSDLMRDHADSGAVSSILLSGAYTGGERKYHPTTASAVAQWKFISNVSSGHAGACAEVFVVVSAELSCSQYRGVVFVAWPFANRRVYVPCVQESRWPLIQIERLCNSPPVLDHSQPDRCPAGTK
jgi:hypothetical protein